MQSSSAPLAATVTYSDGPRDVFISDCSEAAAEGRLASEGIWLVRSHPELLQWHANISASSSELGNINPECREALELGKWQTCKPLRCTLHLYEYIRICLYQN